MVQISQHYQMRKKTPLTKSSRRNPLMIINCTINLPELAKFPKKNFKLIAHRHTLNR